MRRILRCFVAAALLALVGSACSSTLNDAATIKYSVSGTDHEDHVTRADLISEVRKIAADKPFAQWLNSNGYPMNGDLTTGSAVSAVWLSQLINQKAIDALFAARKLKVTPALLSSAASTMPQNFPTADAFSGFPSKFREELVDREARREALISSYVDATDTAGQKYYRDHQSQFACASGKYVAHILVHTQAEAQKILDQLRSGASFAELAQAESTDTQSGAQGGNLGCLTPKTYVAAFQQAADHAPFDTPVGPVHSKFGYHVILVTRPSYDAVRAQVQQALLQQGQAAYQAALAKMLKAFTVHIDPRFGTWVTTPTGGRNYFVQPPAAVTPNTAREGSPTTTTTSVPTGAP